MYEFLKKVPLFADMPEDDLARLCEMVEEVRLTSGETLFTEGSAGDKAYVIEQGQLEVIKESSGRPVLLAVRGAGDVIGEMALLEDAPRTATVKARGDTALIAISAEQLDHLLNSSPSAVRALLHTVLGRFRATSSLLRQSEKMAQLGTLSAGIAHELNNPAAAVKRGASQMQETITAFGQTQARLETLRLDDEQRQALTGLAQKTKDIAARPLMLDPIDRSDKEYEIETWLSDRGVDNAWELAPTLVSLGYDAAGLQNLAEWFNPAQMAVVVQWLGATYTVHNLLAEISQGASRISEIVKALKSYSYLDQAPVQAVDIHEGLDNTLLILRSKLKSVTVQRDYAADLPKIQGYGSELNQVWTNLIDNAADALADRPGAAIAISTRRDGETVQVWVEDNGPGIPENIQPRIFDAFFTTKAPGKGTGLGLDISYNIVVNKHRGDIKVFSNPGRTCFQVTLPIDFDAPSGGQPISSYTRSSDEQMRRILETSHTIAVVGISDRTDRPAHSVPAYLQQQGYRIIPVNPNLTEILGEQAYPDLLAIPEPVDVVEIFRRSEDIPPIVEQAIQIGAKAVWMQETIINEAAGETARQAGLEVVMDECMRATHKRLFGKGRTKS